MLTADSQSLRNSLLSLGIVAFLAVSLFGMFSVGMSMSMDGSVSGCPSMLGMNMCPMTPLEHVSFLQSLLTGVAPHENPLLALLLTLSFVGIVLFAWFRKYSFRLEPRARDVHYFYRQRSFSISRLFQELFSNGILNPKPF